jgi:hypothetical protein
MTSNSKTVRGYLDSLPKDRKDAIRAVREVILANLPTGYEECLQYGMISYVVPHSLYPAGYHCDPSQPLMYASLGSQKNHMALYLMSAYGDNETNTWFREAYKAAGKKLDMGKACVRFRKIDDLPMDVIGKVIARTPAQAYIARIESVLKNRKPKKRAA